MLVQAEAQQVLDAIAHHMDGNASRLHRAVASHRRRRHGFVAGAGHPETCVGGRCQARVHNQDWVIGVSFRLT